MPNNHIIFIDPHDSPYFEYVKDDLTKATFRFIQFSMPHASPIYLIVFAVCGDQRSDEQETVWGKVAVQCIPTVPLEKVRSAHKMCVGSQVCIKSCQFLLCQHQVVAPVQIINVNIVNWSNFLALWHLNRIAALCEPFVQILKLCRVSRWLGEGSHSAVKFYDPY